MLRDFYKGKRVFITGHTGFKGSWLSLWLNDMGAHVTGYSLDPPTDPAMFELCSIDKSVKSVIGDVCDKNHLNESMAAAKPDIVFHLAAQPLVRESYARPAETFETNCMGTVHVLESVRNCPEVRAVVNVTTDKCYEDSNSFWRHREDAPLGGFDPYSASKACSEIITRAYVNSFFHPSAYDTHRVSIATARAGNVIGGGDFALDRLIPDGIRGLLADQSILIRNPHAIRPWQHVLEPLGGYLLLAEKLYSEGAVYNGPWNFGPNEESEQNVEKIIKTLCSLWGSNSGPVVSEAPHLPETGFLKLDSYKAHTLLGYKPRWSVEKALAQVVRWTKVYQEKGDLLKETLRQIAEFEAENSR